MQIPQSRILIVYYSNSGDAGRVVERLAVDLRRADVELVVQRLRPIVEYPFPWRSIGRFFGVLPECHLGPLPALQPMAVDLAQSFDLVILVYQVWFLAPSLPMQSFLQSAAAPVLRDTKVITISVSRNMWHSAAQTMKALLQQAGARHIDHVSLTHQVPAWATFITTPRALLLGKKESFWRLFPAAGISEAELAGLSRFSQAILNQRQKLKSADDSPLLAGLGAVHIQQRYVVPELIGWYWFRGWARLLRLLGRLGSVPRLLGTYLFVVCLIFMVLVVLPLTLLIRLLFYPLMNRWLAAYIRQLQQPSGP